MPESRLLLIDGHNLLFRMFYGMPEIRGRDGSQVQAVVGFASAIRKVLAMVSPTHMLVTFDSEECGDRRKMCPDYKANRPNYAAMDPDECPFTQLPSIYRLLTAMDIPHAEIHGCEADDVIASYAIQCYLRGWKVLIMSTDRDYYQLINNNISVFLYNGYDSQVITPAQVQAKYGVPPDKFADFKCLVGDKSDNINGVTGIGPKRAAALLQTYGSLEGILSGYKDIPQPKLRAAIAEAEELLIRNRQLILLTGSSPLPYEPETLLVSHFSGSTNEILKDIGVF